MKNWKTLAAFITFGASLITLPLYSNAEPAYQAKVIDRVAVTVNNGAILESEIISMMTNVKRNAIQSRQQLPDDETLRSQIIERLIIDSIVEQLGQSAGIKISDQEVDQAILDIARQNKLTLSQLNSHLAADGMSFDTYREQIRKEIMLAEVRNNEIRRRINILPQEVDSLASQLAQQEGSTREFNLSHIMLALPENPTQQQVERAKTHMNSLMTQLTNGANFGKLAVSYSADGQALNGGNMGWGKLEELPPVIAEALENAKKDDIIGPIQSKVGLHIIRVNDIRQSKEKKISAQEVRARHILIKPSIILTDNQAEAKLRELHQDIISNKIKFSDAARQFSEDPGSAQQGGDLGWALADIYDPAFKNVLISLKKGELSQPFRSSFGWHIVELLDTRQIDATENTRKDQAYRMLYNRKFTEETQTWVQELRASAYVRILTQHAD